MSERSTKNEEDECSLCGSSHTPDRLRHAQQDDPNDRYLGFTICPHCGADKCRMCDMGDDVACLACENQEEA